jgi:hypothetical protein
MQTWVTQGIFLGGSHFTTETKNAKGITGFGRNFYVSWLITGINTKYFVPSKKG